MAAPYLDFFGDTPQEEEDRIAAEQAAKASTPEARLAQTIAGNRQSDALRTMGTGPRAEARTNNMAAGRITGGAPSNFGLSLDPSTAAEARTDQGAAHDAMIRRNGGVLGDLGRFAVAGARNLANPFSIITDDYLPEGAAAAVNPVGYATAQAFDEGADRLIPGGSGNYGRNIIPGVKGTGGDSFYPSETTASGSYNDGYRGVGNPRQPAIGGPGSGAPQPGQSAADAASQGAGAPSRPDSYRTDAVNNDIRGLLNAEKRQGPSEAEALLQKATDRVAAQSLGIAAGARGGAGARERAQRQALAGNVALGAEAGSNIAGLRAREDAESRARQAQIMNLLQGNASAGDARDLGYYQSDQNLESSKYNVDAADRRAEASDKLSRDTFNAQQAPGLFDDPLDWFSRRLLGGNGISGGTKI